MLDPCESKYFAEIAAASGGSSATDTSLPPPRTCTCRIPTALSAWSIPPHLPPPRRRVRRRLSRQERRLPPSRPCLLQRRSPAPLGRAWRDCAQQGRLRSLACEGTGYRAADRTTASIDHRVLFSSSIAISSVSSYLATVVGTGATWARFRCHGERSLQVGSTSPCATCTCTRHRRQDPKGRAPDPALGIAEFIPATEGLCERFSYRIARHFAISGESHEGAPQTGAVLPSARPSPTHPAPHPYRAQF